MAQKKNKLDKETLVKIGKGALISAGAVFGTYLAVALRGFDYGTYTPLVTGLLAAIINFLKEFKKGK